MRCPSIVCDGALGRGYWLVVIIVTALMRLKPYPLRIDVINVADGVPPVITRAHVTNRPA